MPWGVLTIPASGGRQPPVSHRGADAPARRASIDSFEQLRAGRQLHGVQLGGSARAPWPPSGRRPTRPRRRPSRRRGPGAGSAWPSACRRWPSSGPPVPGPAAPAPGRPGPACRAGRARAVDVDGALDQWECLLALAAPQGQQPRQVVQRTARCRCPRRSPGGSTPPPPRSARAGPPGRPARTAGPHSAAPIARRRADKPLGAVHGVAAQVPARRMARCSPASTSGGHFVRYARSVNSRARSYCF